MLTLLPNCLQQLANAANGHVHDRAAKNVGAAVVAYDANAGTANVRLRVAKRPSDAANAAATQSSIACAIAGAVDGATEEVQRSVSVTAIAVQRTAAAVAVMRVVGQRWTISVGCRFAVAAGVQVVVLVQLQQRRRRLLGWRKPLLTVNREW